MTDMLEQATSASGDQPPEGGIFLPGETVHGSGIAQLVDRHFSPIVDSIVSHAEAVTSDMSPFAKLITAAALEAEVDAFKDELEHHCSQGSVKGLLIGIRGDRNRGDDYCSDLLRKYGCEVEGWPRDLTYFLPTDAIFSMDAQVGFAPNGNAAPELILVLQPPSDTPSGLKPAVKEQPSTVSLRLPFKDIKLSVLGEREVEVSVQETSVNRERKPTPEQIAEAQDELKELFLPPDAERLYRRGLEDVANGRTDTIDGVKQPTKAAQFYIQCERLAEIANHAYDRLPDPLQ